VSSFATNGGEPGARTGISGGESLGGHLALRGAGAGQDCGGIAVQYPVARVFADIGLFCAFRVQSTPNSVPSVPQTMRSAP